LLLHNPHACAAPGDEFFFFCLSFAFIVSSEVVSKPSLNLCAVCVVALQSTTVWVIRLRYSVFRLNFAYTLFEVCVCSILGDFLSQTLPSWNHFVFLWCCRFFNFLKIFEFVHNMFQVVFICLYFNHLSNPSLCIQFPNYPDMAYFCLIMIIVGNSWCAVYINTFLEIFLEV
jgi:hypothetical protein